MDSHDKKAPKLQLIVNADRELFEAIVDNDPARVSAWLARVREPTSETSTGGRRCSWRRWGRRTRSSPSSCLTAAPTSGAEREWPDAAAHCRWRR